MINVRVYSPQRLTITHQTRTNELTILTTAPEFYMLKTPNIMCKLTRHRKEATQNPMQLTVLTILLNGFGGLWPDLLPTADNDQLLDRYSVAEPSCR